MDVLAHAQEYYSPSNTKSSAHRRAGSFPRRRRGSHDEAETKPRKFILDVAATQAAILAQEDTDGDFQITINDVGPKVLQVGTADSGGYRKFEIRGTYMLSNLLQELALANDYGRRHIILDEARLNENPVKRLSRMISQHFWDGLTRKMDADGIEIICQDPKNRGPDQRPRIYVPAGGLMEDAVMAYYQEVARSRPHLNLIVERLPRNITESFVRDLNEKPGILALAMRTKSSSSSGPPTASDLEAIPFVVPGGRFNEMYGWDSYFESLGLLADGRVDLAQGMVEHFMYEIEHYGKILNANRSYYLCRSQPPFLTDMALRVYEQLVAQASSSSTPPSTEVNKDQEAEEERKREEALEWLKAAMRMAIREYETVWMSRPRLDPTTGLSRYRPGGLGMPPETEATHFDHVLEPYARKRSMSIHDFAKAYTAGTVSEPDLDEYFIHDRAVRESGHDTTYRLDGQCADLATIDLNALLYRYEIDIGESIRDLFGGSLTLADGRVLGSTEWFDRARNRRASIDRYLWNPQTGLYHDWHCKRNERIPYESVTSLWALWAGCASESQAATLVPTALAAFESQGGLVSGTENARGHISLDRPNRQWDFPYGWAPHQMLAWHGLSRYGYALEASRLAYRWLYTITKSFVDFNGVVPEKFDVVGMTHQVKVEYGNVGTDFKLVPREGFGWMNASYQMGLTYLSSHMRRALGALTTPEQFFKEKSRGLMS
ncbi:MAG: neutral trehalase [Piptocephalis tieghemiana]|nr:MAG: neutral trehalase [Piptocephalis tieghemiana]